MKFYRLSMGLGDISSRRLQRGLALWLGLALLALASAGCGSRTEALARLPAPLPSRFNLAVVASGSGIAGDWSEPHRLGVEYFNRLNQTEGGINAVFISGVPELSDQQQLFSRLGELGYRLVVGVEAGYMDSMQAAASRNPGTVYLTLRGSRSNGGNFGSVEVPMEAAYFVAGLTAGARIEADILPPPAATPTASSGAPLPPTQPAPAAAPNVQRLVGVIASFTTPEQLRYINAAALGMHLTCAECRMDVRFLNAWNAKAREMKLAEELLNAGAYVLFATTQGDGALDVVQIRGNRWAIVESLPAKCQERPQCLTSVSWNWGLVYQDLAQKVQPGNFRSEPFYTLGSGGIDVSGMMPNEALSPKVSSIPQEKLDFIRSYLNVFLLGQRKATSIFSIDTFPDGVRDNLGNIVFAPERIAGRPDLASLREQDLHQFPPGAPNYQCYPCMYWFAEWIRSELPWAGN
jgi:basic membrane lipoprotein Med (substrate-binding protein (PBP1-ABC) superfamily)